MLHEKKVIALVYALAGIAAGHAQARGTPRFLGLGDLPGSDFYSQAFGVSHDGSVVVGLSDSGDGTEAFVWTAAGGMHGLGDLPGGLPQFNSGASAVSGNGALVVGHGSSTASAPNGGVEAFRSPVAGPLEGLGFVSGFGDPVLHSSEAVAASYDGTIIAGHSTTPTGRQAVRWTPGGVQQLGYLPGGTHSLVNGMSPDASVVCGYGDATGVSIQAFRWTEATGMQSIGDLPGGSVLSMAYAVSANSNVIVGFGSTTGGQEAFRWTEAGGMQALGDLPGGTHFSLAYAVSGDGSVVAGISNTGTADRAFVWRADLGMVSLRQYLTLNGVTGFDGWAFTQVSCMTPDGLTMVGYGIDPQGNTEGFIATVPSPGAFVTTILGMGLLLRRRR